MSRVSIAGGQLRDVRRAPLCVRALVYPKKGQPAEYLTSEVSVAAVRLCGCAQAHVESEVQVWLFFSQNTVVQVIGKIVERFEAARRPEFEIRLDSVSPTNLMAIRQRTDAALLGKLNPSVLLLEAARDSGEACSWLGSLRSQCRVVRRPANIADVLAKHSIETAVVTDDRNETLEPYVAAYPQVSWRSIDANGRLRA